MLQCPCCRWRKWVLFSLVIAEDVLIPLLQSIVRQTINSLLFFFLSADSVAREGREFWDLGHKQENQPAAGAQARTVSAEGAAFHLVALWEVKFWEALLGTPQSAEGELSTCKTRSRGVGGKKLGFWRLWWDLSASCPHHGNGLLTSCPRCSYCGSISLLCSVFSAFLSFLLALTYLGDSHAEMGLNQPPSRRTLLGL